MHTTAQKTSAALAFMLFFGMSALAPLSHGETIEEAVQQSINNHPDVRSTAHNKLGRTEEVRQAKAAYFPVVDFSAGVGKNWVNEPFSDTLNPNEVRFGLRQNVFAGFSTKNEVERHKARVRSESYLLQSVSENIGLQAVSTYLDVLRNEAIFDLAKENLLLHERISDQIRLRSESGVDRLADMDQIRSRLSLAQANMVVAEQNLQDSETNYLAVVGQMPTRLVRPDFAPELLPPSMQEAEKMAVIAHPQLKSAVADLDARKSQDEVAKSPFMPIIDIEADRVWGNDLATTSRYDERYNNKRDETLLFLRLRYNLFNGWKDDARKAETAHLINEAREIRNHTQRQVIESTRLSWRAYESAEKKVDYLAQRLQFAKATASAYTKQWNIGQRTLLDVLDAEAERIDSARQLVSAEYDGLYAQYRILNSTGQLVPALKLKYPEEAKIEDQYAAQRSSDEEKQSQ